MEENRLEVENMTEETTYDLVPDCDYSYEESNNGCTGVKLALAAVAGAAAFAAGKVLVGKAKKFFKNIKEKKAEKESDEEYDENLVDVEEDIYDESEEE